MGNASFKVKLRVGSLLVLALMIIIALAACGPKVKTSSNNGLQKVVVQNGWLVNGELSPVITAIEKGYYREEGLDVEVRPGGPSGTSFLNSTLMLSQDKGIDIAIDNDIVTLLQGKAKEDSKNQFTVKAFATLWQDNPMGFMVRKDSGLQSIKDLAKKKPNGEKYVIGATAGAVILKPLADYIGVPESELKVVQTGFDASPFLSGQVDALLSFWTTQAYEAEKAGIQYNFLPVSEIPGLSQPCMVALARDETINNKADVLEKWLRATIKGAQDTINNPDKAGEYVIGPNGGGSKLDLTQEKWIIKKSLPLLKFNNSYEKIGYLNENQISNFANTYYNYKEIPRVPSINELIDLSILKRIYNASSK